MDEFFGLKLNNPINFELTYNFTRIIDEIEYKRLPNISEHMLNLNIFKNFNNILISGNLNYYGEKTIIAPTSGIETFIPDYCQINVSTIFISLKYQAISLINRALTLVSRAITLASRTLTLVSKALTLGSRALTLISRAATLMKSPLPPPENRETFYPHQPYAPTCPYGPVRAERCQIGEFALG